MEFSLRSHKSWEKLTKWRKKIKIYEKENQFNCPLNKMKTNVMEAHSMVKAMWPLCIAQLIAIIRVRQIYKENKLKKKRTKLNWNAETFNSKVPRTKLYFGIFVFLYKNEQCILYTKIHLPVPLFSLIVFIFFFFFGFQKSFSSR